MTEQQNHLAGLLEQRQTLVNEINELNNKAAQKKELVLRAFQTRSCDNCLLMGLQGRNDRLIAGE